jgi:hypothetical protein
MVGGGSQDGCQTIETSNVLNISMHFITLKKHCWVEYLQSCSSCIQEKICKELFSTQFVSSHVGPTHLPQRRWASALLRFRLVAHRADAFAVWNSLAAIITAALDALFVLFLLQQQSLIDLWKGYTTLAIAVVWAACVVTAALVFPAQRLVDGMLRSGRLDADDDRWDKCKKAPMVMRPGAASGCTLQRDCKHVELHLGDGENIRLSPSLVLPCCSFEFPNRILLFTFLLFCFRKFHSKIFFDLPFNSRHSLAHTDERLLSGEDEADLAWSAILRLIAHCLCPIELWLRLHFRYRRGLIDGLMDIIGLISATLCLPRGESCTSLSLFSFSLSPMRNPIPFSALSALSAFSLLCSALSALSALLSLLSLFFLSSSLISLSLSLLSLTLLQSDRVGVVGRRAATGRIAAL